MPTVCSPVHEIILQDVEISKVTKERVDHLLEDFNDIMYASASNIAYMNLVKMDIEADPKLSPVASIPCTTPLQYHEQKELEDLGNAGIIQCCPSLYAS